MVSDGFTSGTIPGKRPSPLLFLKSMKKQLSVLFFGIAAFVVCGADQPKAMDILQEAVDYFESGGGVRPIEKKNPKDLSFEIEDDFGMSDLEDTPRVDYGRFVEAGSKFAEVKAKEGAHREAVRMLRACREIDAAQRNATEKMLRDYDFRIASSLAGSGDIDDAVKLLEGVLASGEENIRAIKAIFDAKAAGRDPTPGYDWLEAELRENKRGFTAAQQSELWSYFGFKAFYSMKRPLMERAIAGAESIGKRLQNHGAMCYDAIARFDEMKSFPKPESEIVFPKDLSDFGFDPEAKIVHAKDFGDLGFDEKNATQCLQEALESDASTIIVDNMGSPWYITGVKLPVAASNKKILFKKGVRILGVDDGVSWHSTLFHICGATNVLFIGEEDVRIGHFNTYEERRQKTKGEGGSGFNVTSGNHISLRNLTVSQCCCDALSLGGASMVYVEDCDFDNNYRQGASFGATRNIFFKNVKFRNTRGGDPMSGVDFEPSYEVYPNNNFYFFDCEFTDNGGDGMTFATSTYMPVTVYIKRCTFSSPGASIRILARAGIYVINNSPAPSKIIFDECKIDGHSDSAPIRFNSSSFFNVTFTNCVVNDLGPVNPARAQNHPPVLFQLDRAHWRGFCPLDGDVRFDDCTITGFANSPVIRFAQTYGSYAVSNIYGTVSFNGEKVSLDGVFFRPPELDLAELPSEPDWTKFTKPAAVPPAKEKRGFSFLFGHAYYQAEPRPLMFRWAGAEPERIVLREKLQEERAGAYYAGLCEDRGIRISCPKGFTGYFEVPGGVECAIKLMGGGLEIKNAAGEVVARREATDYFGSECVRFKTSGTENEVFSFTTLDAGASFKFFAPLPGIWAEKPEYLPRLK